MSWIALILTVAWLTASQDVAVTTANGDVLVGSLKAKTLKLETDFGSAEIDIERIAAIRFGEPDVVTTQGGLELVGELSLRTLKLQTEDGTKTLKRAQLVSLTTDLTGASSTGFAGEWSSSFGPLRLEVIGKKVTGTYGWDHDSEIEGELDGDELTFEWRNANGNRGKGSFQLWEDGETFTGKSQLQNGGEEPWGGYRLAPKRAAAMPGEVTTGQTEAMLNYHLRVPADYDAGEGLTAIAFFHGSNMSSRSYVDTIVGAWPELAERYILVGFDAERLNGSSKEGRRVFNATYINFEGDDESYPKWKRSETPALVARSLDELAAFLPIERWFIGGHSQGGFLTYAVAMFYPEKIAGAFPMSCNLLIQCEPSNFSGQTERIAAQHAIPFAHIHGTNDPVVEFSGGVYCYEALQDGGFPMLQLFSDPHAAHMFARLPVDVAVAWLEGMSSEDPAELVAFAKERLDEDEYRDACAAALRARELDPDAGLRSKIDAVLERVDEKAEPTAAKLEKALAANANGKWADDFWEFRRQFALAPSAEPVLAAYAILREKHQPKAQELFWKARSEGDEDAREEIYAEIVADYYASSYYKLVSRWLE